MWVGVNYPWCNCGWDFGEPPSTWQPRARWRTVISEHLAELRRVGIRVVRWFIVADGLGEFATVPGRDTWPDLGADQSVAARLSFARDRGITLALPWSFRAGLRADGYWSGPAAVAAATRSQDDRAAVDWPTLADDISSFTGGAW